MFTFALLGSCVWFNRFSDRLWVLAEQETKEGTFSSKQEDIYVWVDITGMKFIEGRLSYLCALTL